MSASERASLGAPPTQNAQAYEHFLKGDYYVALRTERGDIRAVSEYEEALRLDPTFNRARARMAYTYGSCSNYGYDCFGLGKDSLLARGFAVADSALRQDSTTSDAWLALAFLRLEKDPRRLAGVRQAIENAVRLDPQNAEAHHVHGFVLRLLGEDSSAVRAFQRALAIEPERRITLSRFAQLEYYRRRFRESLALIDSALAVSPQPWVEDYALRSSIERHLGDTAAARSDAERVWRMDSTWQGELILLDVGAGDTAAARARLKKGSGDDASALAALGELDRAVQALEREPLTAVFWTNLKDPDLDPLRGHPRFKRLVERGKPPM
jgi:adenylate cyclase